MLNVTAAATFTAQGKLADAERHLDDILFRSDFPMVGSPAESDANKLVASLRSEVAAMQAVGGKVFLIPEHNVPMLVEKLNKLNQRAAKLGVDPVEYRLTAEFEERKIDGNFYVLNYVTVKGASPKLAGWQFAATLEHDENGVIVRRLPGLDDSVNLSAYRKADPANCDQCGYKRRRNDTYVVLHETGVLKQVGSTCLKDFLGSQSPQQIAQWLTYVADLLDELENEGGEFFGGTAPSRLHTESYLTHVAAMIRLHGWTSKGAAYNYGGFATASAADNNMFNQAQRKCDRQGAPMWDDPTQEDADLAAAAIAHVRDIGEDDLTNDYVYNLFTSLKGESIPARQTGIAASAITFYQKAEQKKAEAKKAAVSQYVGAEGDKLSLDVTVSRVLPIEGAYGTTYLYIMLDAAGNQIKWFSSRSIEGMDQSATGVIRGAVKKLEDDARFGKSTILTRCKFVPNAS